MPNPNITVYSSAVEMLKALDSGDISALELLELHLDRIEHCDGEINAVVIRDFDTARESARQADQRRANSQKAPLLGLPMTIKDCIYLKGLPVTGGVPERANAIAEADAPTVARLREAGAVFIGKTNVPPYAADHQSNNPLFGRTNNPWNLERTPGGSSGGAAAALATGMTPLELGGDLGGSIRVPAAFTGLYGHKSSESAVPRTGHFPGGLLPNDVIYMAVQGPLARTAGDLKLAFDIISGPPPDKEHAMRISLPESRHSRLQDFRVAVMPEIDGLPVDHEILRAQYDLASKLSKLGATVETALPNGFGSLSDYMGCYLRILGVMSSPSELELIDLEIEREREAGRWMRQAMADGFAGSADDYISWFGERERYRQVLRSFFNDWDILLAPCNITNAFPHTDLPREERQLAINSDQVPYDLQLFYPSLCNLTGYPGTAFPVGFTRDGLPIGLQAIGPYLEDFTPIAFAGLVEQQFGGFQAPPEYGAS